MIDWFYGALCMTRICAGVRQGRPLPSRLHRKVHVYALLCSVQWAVNLPPCIIKKGSVLCEVLRYYRDTRGKSVLCLRITKRV